MEPNFETVQADADSSFRSTRFTCASFAEDHSWHYHPEFELTWILRSEGTRFIGDSIEPYRTDDLVFIGPNLPHCYHDEPPATGINAGPELIVLQFRPESFGADFLGLPETRQINELFRASKCGLHVRGETSARVRELMMLILEKKGMGRLMVLLEILQTLAQGRRELRALASADYHINNDITEANRRRIEFIHRHVRENLGREISQPEIAASINLTPQAFSRFFRKATGQTFVGFVNILRINAVCRLLMETNQCITEIAMDCGYNNIANFNRQFMALKGMNPTQFRERRLHLLDRPASIKRLKRPPEDALFNMANSAS
jgi:AraC-like DNA-binding protein